MKRIFIYLLLLVLGAQCEIMSQIISRELFHPAGNVEVGTFSNYFHCRYTITYSPDAYGDGVFFRMKFDVPMNVAVKVVFTKGLGASGYYLSGDYTYTDTGDERVLRAGNCSTNDIYEFIMYGIRPGEVVHLEISGIPVPATSIPEPEANPEPSAVSDPSVIQLSRNMNYIAVVCPREETGSLDYTNGKISNYASANPQVTVQYYDGLSRPVQQIAYKSSPQKKDLVSIKEYSAWGQGDESWLPASFTTNGAYFQHSALKVRAKATNGDNTPYSKSVYENSPLNRILEQYGPGADWHNNKKAVRTTYMTNTAGVDTLNCIYYTIADTGDTIVSVTRSRNYDSGQLYVTRIEDEDGNTSLEFKDKLGQVVLTRQIQRNGNSKDLHDTYYIYDDFGNLKAVLPPLAADAMKTGTSWANNTSELLRNYTYLYKYDGRNRCIAKRLPGTHWTYYVYDKADQLILSQDGEQRANSQWAFNAYDKFGRVIFSGIHKDHYGPSAGRTHNYLINQFKDLVIQETSGWLYSYSLLLFNQLGTAPYGYKRCNGIANEILQVNYYDNYNCTGRPEFADIKAVEPQPTGYIGTEYSSAKGLLTGTLTYYNEENGNTDPCYHDLKSIATVIRYDNRGRVIQTKSTNHLGGVDKEFVDYNFTGQPTKRKHIHSATGKTTQTEDYAYSYDHAGRLLKTTHKLNGGTEMILAENTYDELGRLREKKSNSRNELTGTYTYNVRSWLSRIRHYHFHEDLNYTHSGNIKNMQWVLYGQTRKYDYTYDNLSRLKAATFTGITGEQYSTAYTYDKHGNILTLQRYGKKDAGTNASSFGLVDNLTMTYAGNQLIKAEDAAANVIFGESADFKNHNNAAVEYTYNKNGAMTKDLNKGVSQIQYNSLNLPTLTDIKNPEGEGRNYYTYSASGVKLKVKHTYNPNFLPAPVTGSDVNVSSLTQVTETDYVGNKIYENGALKRVLIDGGYIEGGTYYFYVNDHLGNNRAVARADGPMFQRNHYYPFGMTFADSYNSNIQPYKYNGKELDRKHGLNLYDYSARYYDQAIGRFTTVDPLAEKYYSWSPYAYVMNNPLKYIDPDGKAIIVSGALSKRALQELQSAAGSSITLTIADDGNICYTKNIEEKLLFNAAKIVEIIDNNLIFIDLKTINGGLTSTNNLFVGGAFMGNEVYSDRNGNKTVVASQEINPNVLGAADKHIGTPGSLTMHELTEAYIGAQNSQKSGSSAPPATGSNANNSKSPYTQAHDKASFQNPIFERMYDSEGNITTDVNSAVRVEWFVKSITNKDKVIQIFEP